MSKKELEELKNEFEGDKSLQVAFWFRDQNERRKADSVAKELGLSLSAVIRMLLLREHNKLKAEK